MRKDSSGQLLQPSGDIPRQPVESSGFEKIRSVWRMSNRELVIETQLTCVRLIIPSTTIDTIVDDNIIGEATVSNWSAIKLTD